TAGRAFIGGFDIHQQPIEARRVLAYVPDTPFLYDKLTPCEFLRFVGELYGMDRVHIERGIKELFDLFSLTEYAHDQIETLSHGTRQRLVIASALLHDPKVFIIDEPMVGLDPRSARVVKDVLKERSRNGMTVFLSTHILHIAEELADRIGILNNGRLIAVGTMEELRVASGVMGALEDAFLALTRSEEEEGVPAPEA
ncbi:MAG: ABC transporter ATP-binding protein, partial [Verrucomicrobiae bacterium]|nr:ABC transporter ATP-binding protein [Verrucomicrobiae bacterium]